MKLLTLVNQFSHLPRIQYNFLLHFNKYTIPRSHDHILRTRDGKLRELNCVIIYHSYTNAGPPISYSFITPTLSDHEDSTKREVRELHTFDVLSTVWMDGWFHLPFNYQPLVFSVIGSTFRFPATKHCGPCTLNIYVVRGKRRQASLTMAFPGVRPYGLYGQFKGLNTGDLLCVNVSP